MWRLDLPLIRPLSLNDRQHYMSRAREIRNLRDTACTLARAHAIPKLWQATIELHYVPRDRRRRDPLNLVATLKAVEDGIVDAGIIPDDTPEYSIPTMPVIDPPSREANQSRLYVLISGERA